MVKMTVTRVMMDKWLQLGFCKGGPEGGPWVMRGRLRRPGRGAAWEQLRPGGGGVRRPDMAHIALVSAVTLQLVTLHPEAENKSQKFGELWVRFGTFLGGFFWVLVWEVTLDGRLNSISFLFSLMLVMALEWDGLLCDDLPNMSSLTLGMILRPYPSLCALLSTKAWMVSSSAPRPASALTPSSKRTVIRRNWKILSTLEWFIQIRSGVGWLSCEYLPWRPWSLNNTARGNSSPQH